MYGTAPYIIEVFVIWEDDWKKSKTKIINEVIKWWNNGNKTN